MCISRIAQLLLFNVFVQPQPCGVQVVVNQKVGQASPPYYNITPRSMSDRVFAVPVATVRGTENLLTYQPESHGERPATPRERSIGIHMQTR